MNVEYDTLDRTAIAATLLFVAICIVFACVRRKRLSNRQINLPPPSSACRRNSTESVP